MKKIIFTRSDYVQIRHIKYVFTLISINVYSKLRDFPQLQSFQSTLSEKLQSFLTKYDVLKQKMSITNPDIAYFTNDLAELGISCLHELDVIGEFIDDNFQFYSHIFKETINAWLEIIY